MTAYNKILTFCLMLFVSFTQADSLDLKYYFGDEVTFDPNVPTPESVLGYQVGEWHVRPEQIAEYMYALAANSNRVWVEEIGRSWERRPLLLVSFSSSDNIKKLPQIKAQHTDIKKRDNKGPAVVWMGYSVHGNEASGANAAVLLAYYLAAAQGQNVEQWLADSVVLLDPMLNPDGLSRFASWVNSHRSSQLVSDPYDREHNEVWPGGRTNHYWFDLNRDWLLAQHPESRARLTQFHQWKPLVVTDFHEMGTNSTYFFQPGVPSRQNPLTPEKNFELTSDIAKYHANALDLQGTTYFTKEGFDDFYFGKGSTYPDLNGAVGILFEQASVRGHLQQSINGDISFPFAVRNQLTASFSTLKAVQDNRLNLLKYQQSFYNGAIKEAKDHPVKGYVYYANGDETRLKEFNRVLDHHQIKYYQLARDLKTKNKTFKKQQAYIVPLQQAQFRLIRTLFETGTKFKDNTFYDVSSWTLALSFNLDYSSVSKGDFSSRLLGAVGHRSVSRKSLVIDPATIALAIDWGDSSASAVASRLLRKGITLRVATKNSKFKTIAGEQGFQAGTLFIPLGMQAISRDELSEEMADVLVDTQVNVTQITSGLATRGIDLGSPSMKPVVQPSPILLVGKGVSGYEAGEIWHLLDTRLEIATTKVDVESLKNIPMHHYTHLIMPSGKYQWNDAVANKIEKWIKQGGQLISSRTSGRWLAKQAWSPIKKPSDEKSESDTQRLKYSERDQYRAEKFIGGAIFDWNIDSSHPLAFGIKGNRLPVFRRGSDTYEVNGEPFAVVAQYTDKPLLSGYASKENVAKIAGSPALVAIRKGQGSVIYVADNMNFRAYWWGTSKVFANALYFGTAFQSSAK